MTFPKLSPCLYVLQEFKFFSSQNPGVKIIWLLPFIKWKRALKGFLNFILEIFQIQKLNATQWFSREKIKWILQIIGNMSWKFLWSILKFIFKFELFGFYSNYFSPKIKYMENRVTWFPTVENWREIKLKSFWYFQNDFYWILLQQ